jgi:diaminopimelate decarboxylase
MAALRLMKEYDCSVTLVSGTELLLAVELGFDPHKLMQNGNGQLDWELFRACYAVQ